jgi:hypothetical protein
MAHGPSLCTGVKRGLTLRERRLPIESEISHGDEYRERHLVGCDSVQSGKNFTVVSEGRTAFIFRVEE